MQEKLDRYLTLLLEANARFNLTAIRNPEGIRVRHFEDSLRLLEAASFPGKRVLDAGSGAGFPGLVLKIAEPSIRLTLLDATGKKVRFLQSVCDELGFSDGVLCVHGRAEELGHDSDFRERYDIVTARGVAALPALCEVCLPFVKTGGVFLAMKETPEVYPGAKRFGGEQDEAFAYTLSDGRSHAVCRFRKVTATPAAFPRSWGKIKADG
ncbi:MAG: 16S rRNA (guanine(527)-N(7))-methyltransferase RsmG [Oscillospiraceae bacterium]|jgi:16S rRNA (guanine527-N7)-methyltransferase|nr:16S rRNA (guanine(527)-N(7))-methyltransferase RsmG [Oscillospiraceae bacterium]